MTRPLAVVIVTASLGWLALAAAPAENVHFTYMWHLEQPIYWPERRTSGLDRYEYAWQSIQRTDGGATHPANDLRNIFGLADRVAAYQARPRDSLNAIRWTGEGGVQVSFSGGLIENIGSLGAVNQLGYSPTWHQWFREARGWTTSGGRTRMDIVVFPFHHPLLPLIDEAAARKELQLYKAIYADAWGAAPARSRGLFPPEMAFSERLIPLLVSEGIDWAIVSNEHISRGCTNYPLVLGSGGANCDPPNKADQLNGSQSNWIRTSISRGCSPVNASPFAFTPRYARWVDPNSGLESKLIVVPSDQALSWLDGYAPMGLSGFDALQVQNPAARPQLVVLSHDGDNAWGGGYSYYMEAVPNFVSQANAAGYVCSTIEEYLADHPPPLGDVVHVEDGAWVNADGDFGSPQMLNWLWPLLNSSGQIDIPNGWHVDARNWAVITAAQNRVETAESRGGPINIQKILYPDAATTNAERAWHYFLGALNSGYMYYGNTLDMEVKPTIACNRAVEYADYVLSEPGLDAVGPTVFIPQRQPWNPGSLNFGPQYGYQQYNSNGDFWVWTFVYDVGGVQSVTLKYRTSVDPNAGVTDHHRTYAGGSAVNAWQSLAMTPRAFPAGNVYGDPTIDFFVMPAYIATQYSAEITGIRSQLVDYYVEALDNAGNIKRSPIQHAYVGDGSGGGPPGGPRVVFTPSPGQAGQPIAITYDAAGGPLGTPSSVYAHVGYNNWSQIVAPDPQMSYDANDARWKVTLTVPITAYQIDVAFRTAGGQWDNNNGQDWHAPVTGTQSQNWVMDGQLDADAALLGQNGTLRLWAGIKGNILYVACSPALNGRDHFVFVASPPGTLRGAPWAKSGQVANWAAFLAGENDNTYAGWFDARQGTVTGVANNKTSGVLEGTIDIAYEIGSLPRSVWLAFAPYATADGGVLSSALQIPTPSNGNGVVEAAEFVEFRLWRPGDADGDGCIDQDDLDAVLFGFGGCTGQPGFDVGADFDLNGCIDQDDLDTVLFYFGAGC